MVPPEIRDNRGGILLMDIERMEPRQGHDAEKRITYCLDQLEEVDEFSDGIEWQTEVAPHLTVEELIGALVAAEVKLSAFDFTTQNPGANHDN